MKLLPALLPWDKQSPTRLEILRRRHVCRADAGHHAAGAAVSEERFRSSEALELVYTVKDPYVLGAGTAAFRDVGSFFKYDAADDFGTANPLAGHIKWEIIRGSSQSGTSRATTFISV
jgi:hypothetical protein